MKKFLMLVLAFFIIVPAVKVSAAYVTIPPFESLDHENIELLRKEHKYHVTGVLFYIKNGNGISYAEKYTQDLISQNNFKIVKENYDASLNMLEYDLIYIGSNADKMKTIEKNQHMMIIGSADSVDFMFVDGIAMITFGNLR